MASAARTVRVGVLGCGNVGGALVELIDTEADAIAEATGIHLEVSRVAVRSLAKPRAASLGADRLTHDAHAVATDPAVDLVVELIGGIEPARNLILAALKAGKPVVTANKELLANFGAELLRGCRGRRASSWLFEAAVAGAIPLVRALRVSLAGERIAASWGSSTGRRTTCCPG